MRDRTSDFGGLRPSAPPTRFARFAPSRFRDGFSAALVGIALGFALSRIGFSSWDEVHRMFRFQDLRLFLAFASGVALLSVGWALVRRFSSAKPVWTPRTIHRGTFVGGALFGAGWAIGGACPGIALVQLGEGQLGAAVTFAGMLGGNWLYSVVHERWLEWPTQSCVDE